MFPNRYFVERILEIKLSSDPKFFKIKLTSIYTSFYSSQSGIFFVRIGKCILDEFGEPTYKDIQTDIQTVKRVPVLENDCLYDLDHVHFAFSQSRLPNHEEEIKKNNVK